jgi:hypothetical protein
MAVAGIMLKEVRVCVGLSDACGFVPQKLQHFHPSCASRCCGFPLGEKLSEQNCNILKAVVKFLHWVKNPLHKIAMFKAVMTALHWVKNLGTKLQFLWLPCQPVNSQM